MRLFRNVVIVILLVLLIISLIPLVLFFELLGLCKDSPR
jgi:hypothetical protein